MADNVVKIAKSERFEGIYVKTRKSVGCGSQGSKGVERVGRVEPAVGSEVGRRRGRR